MPTLIARRDFTWLAIVALTATALPARAAARQDMLAFDAVYIPALFLTGSAGRSAPAAARAGAALARLHSQWPALRARLQAVWPHDRGWQRTLEAVQGQIEAAQRQAAAAAWPASHETLEQTRLVLKAAREARGMDYEVDRLTAFHEPMEQLAQAGSTWDAARLTAQQRGELERLYAQARVRWRLVETMPLDAQALALSPAREAQLRKAIDDEGASMTALSQALRGGDAAALLAAATAIKPPFVRAFTAFGLAEGEALRA